MRRDAAPVTHTVHMNQPIRTGTARRLGIRRPRWTAGAVITRPMLDAASFRDGGIITAAEARRAQRRNR